MSQKQGFDGPTVGVRLTLREAQVIDAMSTTLGPVACGGLAAVDMAGGAGLD